MTEKEALIALSSFVPFGSARIGLFREYFGSARAAWSAPVKKFAEIGLSEKLVFEFRNFRDKFDVDSYFARLKKYGVQVLVAADREYPNRLAEISDPPVVLYLKGELLKEDSVCVAIVGSRKVTSYGRNVAERLSSGLADAGVTVVSGLALGVDGIAHKATLEGGGRTVAVIGSGLDDIYPPAHRWLAQKIIKSGAVISEYPLSYPALPINFPHRNRIISGMSLGVVVIEGTDKSGTLLTAAHAASQGRDVFAVPGPITSPTSAAPNLLIKQGAKMVTDVRDILEELDIRRRTQGVAHREIFPESDEESIILGILENEPLHIDDVVRRSEKEPGFVISTLTTMELKGLVKALGGGMYERVK